MLPSYMSLWPLFQKNYNQRSRDSQLLTDSILTHYHCANYSRLLWDVLTNYVNERSSSRNSSKTRNLSDLVVKSLTWLSSAKIQRNVTAHPRKSLTLKNPDSHFPLGNGVPKSFACLEKSNPIPKGFLIERKVYVSFAKRNVILPKIVPQPQIKLNTFFLNKKNQMMISSFPYQQTPVISIVLQTVLSLNPFTQSNFPPFSSMTIQYLYLLSKSKLSLPNITNLSQPLVLLTLVLSDVCLILLFFLLSIRKLRKNTSKQQMERSLQPNQLLNIQQE